MKKIIYCIIGTCLLFVSGCSNWLDVSPKNKLDQDEMFLKEDGFKNALTGIYIQLKSNTLYGRELTMEFTENLAQHWQTNPQALDGYTVAYDYSDGLVEKKIKEIYGQFYNTIVNLNNLLDFVDNGVLTSDMYKLIKGETLALRAFCHLDILRLFGPVPGEQTDKRILTYARAVALESLPVNTYAEYIAYLEQDLNEAEALLKEVDNKELKDDFFAYRENRMNYWAVLGTKARFYLWIQNKPKAAGYAKMLIGSDKFRLNQGEDFAVQDLIATPEHLFALHVYNLDEIVGTYFFQDGSTKQIKTKVQTDIFESDITDFRLNYLWKEFKEKAGVRYTLIKYTQVELAPHSQQIPLIRLYEMYLIAIECTDNATEYRPLIEELVAARNISVLSVETVDKKNEFVAKEYQKEFYGEGQQFFQYKRKGDKNILWSEKEGSTEVYVLPLPETEIKYE